METEQTDTLTVEVEHGDAAPAAGVSRRSFVQALGAGLMIVVAVDAADGQQAPGGRRGGGGGGGGRGGRGGGGPANVAARVHIGQDGTITVLTGKVECGQGARAELTQGAAEELRVPPDRVRLVMADTSVVPDDGITAGSRTSPASLPSVRQGCAAARSLLLALAAKQWGVEQGEVELKDGKATHTASNRALTYADLANSDDAKRAFGGAVPRDVTVIPVAQWQVMGTSVHRPNAKELVTGAHRYPSDITLPGMLHGKVLRAPSYGAKLVSIDPAEAKAMPGVTVVQDGSFVGVVAPNIWRAQQALDALEKSAKWERAPHPSSDQLFDYLREHARGGVPKNPFADEVSKAAKSLRQAYRVAYVQHAPMEPRAAVAQWGEDGKLTVWTGSQNPFGCRAELARTFGLDAANVRVVVPDFGGGFGGKHTPDAHIEAARLAKAAGKPVALRWTREEEFTWAAFRPAALIDAEASLDDSGKLTSWYFVNVNSGGSAIEAPYKTGKAKTQFIPAEPAPLRHASYRGLAATANSFARECFMDELAAASGQDPLAFRLAHLQEPRLRAVLEAAAKHFGWEDRVKRKEPNVGVGLACSTEKGSYVAACAEVAVDPEKGTLAVRHVCEAFECGKVVNPDNLTAQVQGAVIMGLGPALREAMRFEEGAIRNASFGSYKPPRFDDVPRIDVHLLDRPDLSPVGAGETPLIVIAPAIANAVFNATGQRVREMPIKLEPAAKRA